jgi:hypothetical protein
VRPVIARYAGFVHLLPASEAHHHRGAGGLLRHGLEVAFHAARAAQGRVFAMDRAPSERRALEPRWLLAACLAGLCHDLGKPVADLAAVDASGRSQWRPLRESLTDWAAREGVDRYYLRWHERRHRRHEAFGVLVLERVLTPEVTGWLSEPEPGVLEALLAAVAGLDQNGVLGALVAAADRASVEQDVRESHLDPDTVSLGVPVERYVLDALRRLLHRGGWTVNQPGARLWRFADGLYVVWRAAAEEVTALLAADRVPGVPRDADTLADVLIERGLARACPLTDPPQRYWRMVPAALERGGEPVVLTMLRLADPGLLFAGEPPPPVAGHWVDAPRSSPPPVADEGVATLPPADEPAPASPASAVEEGQGSPSSAGAAASAAPRAERTGPAIPSRPRAQRPTSPPRGGARPTDPLHSFNRATEVATRVAALIPSETGNDPFKAFGQMALNHVVQGLIASAERPSLVSLRRYLEGGAEALVARVLEGYLDARIADWRQTAQPFLRGARDADGRARGLLRFYREAVRGRFPSTLVEGLMSLYEHERVHFAKMVSSLMPVLGMLTAAELGPLLSPDAADPGDTRRLTHMGEVLARGQVAYLGLDSLSDGMVGSAIGSILLADLTAVAGDRYNYGVGLRPVTVFVDEAAEVINDPFVQLLNKGRGARVRLVIATQTFADFAARTGSEAKARQVLGNVNNLTALRVLDGETQKYVAEALPTVRLKSLVRSQGSSTHPGNPLVFTGSVDERLVEEEGALFPAQLLGQLPNLHYLALLSGSRVVKGHLPILGVPQQAA